MLPVTALLVAMVVFYQFEHQSRAAALAVEQTFEIRAEIRRALAQMVNAETGIRGYLLSGRESSSSRIPPPSRNCRGFAPACGGWCRTIRRRARDWRTSSR
jgi:hypothetical protein